MSDFTSEEEAAWMAGLDGIAQPTNGNGPDSGQGNGMPAADPEPNGHTPVKPARPWPTLDKAAMQGLAGEFVAIVEPHTEADPVALLLQFLAAFGSAVGRSPHFKAEADRHGCNLDVSLTGDSAKGRKGVSWGHVREVFELADVEWASNRVQNGLSSGEGLIWPIRDAITKRVPVTEGVGKAAKRTGEYVEQEEDSGVEDKRLLVQESELSKMFKVMNREGNTLSPILRDAWDGRSLGSLVKNSPARASHPHISIIGHITRTELVRHLNEIEAANGFANRFLFACVKRSKLLPEGGQVPWAEREQIGQDLKCAIAAGRHIGLVRRDSAARKLWHEVYPKLSEDRAGIIGHITARSEAQTMRLALIYAVLDLSEEIRLEHLQAALAVWDYCDKSAAYIFGDKLGDPVADDLLAALRAAGPAGMTRNQIREHFQRHKTSDQIAAALELLQQQRLVRQEQRETGGRPAEVWIAI